MDERGWGVYARRDFTKGETVIRSRALQIHPTSGTHTIQTGWNTHVTMDLPAILLNHSCSPNLSIQVNNDGAYDFVAILPIQANEEVHFDYETCEYDFKMKCLCGSNNCKGELKGYKYHGPSILQAHGTNGVSPYLLSKSNHAFNSIIS